MRIDPVCHQSCHQTPTPIFAPQSVALPSGKRVPFELLMQYVYYSLIEDASAALQTKEKAIHYSQAWLKNKESVRSTEVEAVIAEAESLKSVNKVKQTSSALSFFTAGIKGIATGNTALGVVSLISGGCVALDALFGGAASQMMTSWLSRTIGETEETWKGRYELFASLASVGLAFGLGVGFDTSPTNKQATINAAFNVLNLATKGADLGLAGMQAYVKERENAHRASLIGLEVDCEAGREELDKLAQIVDQLSKELQRYIEQRFEVEQNRASLHSGICRSIV